MGTAPRLVCWVCQRAIPKGSYGWKCKLCGKVVCDVHRDTHGQQHLVNGELYVAQES